jgi:hypothetical protein
MTTNYLQSINNVLKRLREDEVTSVNDNKYSKLIGVLINDAKREIEDAYNWNALTTNLNVVTAAGVQEYTLTGSGQRFVTYYVLNDTQNTTMCKATAQWIDEQKYLSTQQNGAPHYYAYTGVSGSDNIVTVSPVPDTAYTLKFFLKVPQNDLSLDADIIKVPAHLVEMLAYAKAVAERGEDGGMSFSELYQQYRLSLADAVALEANRYEEETMWNEV